MTRQAIATALRAIHVRDTQVTRKFYICLFHCSIHVLVCPECNQQLFLAKKCYPVEEWCPLMAAVSFAFEMMNNFG